MNKYDKELEELANKCKKMSWNSLLKYWSNICLLKLPVRPFFWEIPSHVELSFGDFLNQINNVGFDEMCVAVKFKGRGKHKTKWYIFAEYIEAMDIDHTKKILENDIREIFRNIPK